MPNTKQKERALRQVNIDTHFSAVSESLNTTAFSLTQTEDVTGDISVTSPVMKKMQAIPVTIPASAPTEAEVIEAHNEVGMTLAANSKKHPRRVQRAEAKRAEQRDFLSKRSTVEDNISHIEELHADRMTRMKKEEREQYQSERQKEAFNTFEKLNIEKLMFDKSGKTSFEKLSKNYLEIKTAIHMLPMYEKEIALRLSNTHITDEEKEALNHSTAKLKTLYDIRAYYDIYEKILLNKYYALLPRNEMLSLSYDELRLRLQKQYTGAARNDELIDFYQNLIRLRELGLSDAASVKERQEQYYTDLTESKKKEDTRDPKEELEKMATAYSNMTDYLKKQSVFVTEKSAQQYYAKLFELFGSDIKLFRSQVTNPGKEITAFLAKYDEWKSAPQMGENQVQGLLKPVMPKDEDLAEKDDGSGVKGIALSDAQKENVKMIGAWIMRHSVHSTRKYPSFALNLLQTTPEQQLVIYYLIENEKQDSAMGIDFFTALNNYQPDLANFRKKVKLDNLSRAFRSSMAVFGQMKSYGALSSDIADTDSQIAKDKDPATADQRPLTEKRKSLIKAVSQRGALLRMLYRNAGMHEDMPPDMAADPVLRKKLFDEYRKIDELVVNIAALNKQINDGAAASPDYQSDKVRASAEELREEDRGSTLDTAGTVMSGVKDYVSDAIIGSFADTVDAVGGYASAMTETKGYTHFSGWSGGLTALFGFATATVAAVGLALEDGITAADRTAQALAVSADFIDSTGGILSAVGTLHTAFTSVASDAASGTTWLGSASDAAFSTMSVGDKIAFFGGAATVIAGGVKTAASGVQLGRSISSRHDVKRSRKTLDAKTGELTKDERNLQQFLKHQDKTITRNEVSAGVGMATGIAAMVMGGLAMTGFLAPIAAIVGLGIVIGDIGFGKLYNLNRRHANRKKTVDDMLGMDALVQKFKDEHPNNEDLKKMKDSALRDMIREEALSMMGFSSYHECFRHLCQGYAATLYNKVFVENPQPADRAMYLDAMKSLGLKVKEPATQGDEPKPSINAIITKMME